MKKGLILLVVSSFYILFISNCKSGPEQKSSTSTSSHDFGELNTDYNLPELTPSMLQKIARRVHGNETNYEDTNLIAWNDGEDFISLGYFHIIWFCINTKSTFTETFPGYVQYLRNLDYKLPEVLSKNITLDSDDCPWSSKSEFEQFKKGEKDQYDKLKKFLKSTYREQQEYGLLVRFNNFLRDLPQHRSKKQLKQVMNNIRLTANEDYYPLLDYINFKGEGFKIEIEGLDDKYGLLQVLERMSSPTLQSINPLQAFSIGAAMELSQRVSNRPKDVRWLKGWLHRVCSYSDVKVVPSIKGEEYLCPQR